MRCLLLALFTLVIVRPAGAQDHADRVHVTEDSDPRAVAIAQSVVEKMGGWDAWDATRYLCWDFMGSRKHIWDRYTNDIRIEPDSATVILMNIDTLEGEVWQDGERLTEPDSLSKMLVLGHRMWVNDAYWLIMPFKLLDPGVTLKYLGERDMEDGRPSDVLELTFTDGTGYTSRNKYDVCVARDTGLVEQWSYFTDRDDPEPRFTGPWAEWKRFGGIMIATSHGRGHDWNIRAPAEVPRTAFTSPDPVTIGGE